MHFLMYLTILTSFSPFFSTNINNTNWVAKIKREGKVFHD